MNTYLFYGLLFIGVIIEIGTYQLLKNKQNKIYYGLGIIGFVFISIVLSELFSIKGVIKTHILFHIISIIITVLVGLFITKEVLTNQQLVGILFGILCIFLIESDEHNH